MLTSRLLTVTAVSLAFASIAGFAGVISNPDRNLRKAFGGAFESHQVEQIRQELAAESRDRLDPANLHLSSLGVDEPASFLPNVAVGDEIYFAGRDGTRQKYTVRSITPLSVTEAAADGAKTGTRFSLVTAAVDRSPTKAIVRFIVETPVQSRIVGPKRGAVTPHSL